MKTIRQEMIDLLTDDTLGARELSQELHISEKEIYDHLGHIARSLQNSGRRLILEPAQCSDCGYPFRDRKRLTPPGHCPKCKKTHIKRPLYSIG